MLCQHILEKIKLQVVCYTNSTMLDGRQNRPLPLIIYSDDRQDIKNNINCDCAGIGRCQRVTLLDNMVFLIFIYGVNAMCSSC